MKIVQALSCAFFMFGIAGCGGGGSKASSSKPGPEGVVTVAFTTQPISTEFILGDDNNIGVAGTWTGTNLGSGQVHLQVTDSAGTFTMPGTQQALAGGQFSYALPLASVGSGQRNGTLTIRACKDAQCAQPYANASATLTYQVQVYEPTVTVAIATRGPIVETIDLGDNYSTQLGGTWSSAHLGKNQVYLQVSDNAGTFSTPEPQLATIATFNYTLPLVPGLPTAPRSGLLTVRACKDVLCTKPYPNSTTSIAYQLQFMRIDEWETHQRNAAHDGYVPITLDPARFAKAWEWQNPATQWVKNINSVATSNGSVFVSTGAYFTEGKVYSLSEASGQVQWSLSLGSQPALNPPAYHDGQLYVSTTGHQDTYLWSFDAIDGTFKFKAPFAAQWPSVLAPTVFDGQVYTNGGYYGGFVYAYDRLNGQSLWANGGGDDDMATPAVDKDNAYFHTGASLMIWNRVTGQQVANIADPFATPSGYDYHGSPMLGGRNNVIAFAGSASSGSGFGSTEHYTHRVLSSFDIGTRKWEWASRNAYLTHPAVAKGVIYAARNQPNYLDAIDETTGQILWSWSPLPDQGDTEFHRNIVVTRNLLFVSTNVAVYAIDLATHKPVWRYPVPGMLAISGNRTLYIVSGATETNGKVIAIRLK